jgi:transcriptional regulator with XRE-family HTH domain
MKELGAALAALRHVRGLKQNQLAHRAGITPGMLCAYERGKQAPRMKTLSAILGALKFSLGQLEQVAELLARLKGRKVLTREETLAAIRGAQGLWKDRTDLD